ncbi:hypothetical protein BKA80DRAFT_256286 [Phyllosticta citrichinensis]
MNSIATSNQHQSEAAHLGLWPLVCSVALLPETSASRPLQFVLFACCDHQRWLVAPNRLAASGPHAAIETPAKLGCTGASFEAEAAADEEESANDARHSPPGASATHEVTSILLFWVLQALEVDVPLNPSDCGPEYITRGTHTVQN